MIDKYLKSVKLEHCYESPLIKTLRRYDYSWQAVVTKQLIFIVSRFKKHYSNTTTEACFRMQNLANSTPQR